MYKRVFVAGTFDGIHKGHEALLMRAFAESQNVTIGLTSDAFVKKYKKSTKIFAERKQGLETWLGDKKATIIAIDDPYEPAASIDIDGLVVSTETRKRGEEINEKRREKGLQPLILFEVPMISAEDNKTLSSSRIRNGEVDKEGKLVMPDNLRPELQQPLGKLVTEIPKRKFIITVGDVTTETFIKAGKIPDLAIIDHRVGRKPYGNLTTILNTLIIYTIKVKSGPGFISKEAMQTIKAVLNTGNQSIKRYQLIEVNGEEDLLVLPAIVEARLGSFVYYGQPARNASASVAGGPNEGMVEVEVTQERKQQVVSLLEKFLKI